MFQLNYQKDLDIGKIYLLNSFNGDLIWMNNNTYPFSIVIITHDVYLI